MKYLYFFALVSLSLVACKDKNTAPEDTGTIIEATYQNATVYTGSTDYSFLTEQAEEIMIRIPNYEEEPSIIVPDGLLENPDTLDGPQGMNPLLQGETFKLYYSKAGEVYKVSIK